MKRLLRVIALLALCALTLAARCWNLRDVFNDGKIFFIDADCYSRMTRAAMVAAGRALIIRHHDFENFPHGTTPHTTAPLDWLIALGKKALDVVFAIVDRGGASVLHAQTLDLAGALVSPLLGVLLCAWLWKLGDEAQSAAVGGIGHRIAFAWTAPLLVAISPILVHGTLLGRPDHQSLLMLTLAVALGAEWKIARLLATTESAEVWAALRKWCIGAAIAWAVSLWVSLYEPAVLLAAIAVLWLIGDRRRFSRREFRAGWIAFAAVLALAFAIDGRGLFVPDSTGLGRWLGTIGELRHLDLRDSTVLRWLGMNCAAAPVLLAIGARKDRRLWAALALLLLTLGLTIWQIRWGYFLALVFAMTLPMQLAVLPRSWLGSLVFFAGFWTVAQDWDALVFPDEATANIRAEKRTEATQLRDIAQRMRGPERAGFIAPWWISPALAYWSGQPGVAGSSHEALPGTMETAHFFLAANAADGEAIARRLGARWVVTDGPDEDGVSRLTKGYGPVLDAVPQSPFGVMLHDRGQPQESVSADDLRDASPESRARMLALAARAEAEQLGTAAFTCVFKNQFFKLFQVLEPAPHHE